MNLSLNITSIVFLYISTNSILKHSAKIKEFDQKVRPQTWLYLIDIINLALSTIVIFYTLDYEWYWNALISLIGFGLVSKIIGGIFRVIISIFKGDCYDIYGNTSGLLTSYQGNAILASIIGCILFIASMLIF